MGRLIEAIDIKRKTFFEFEDAPYVCLDAEVSKPTARGGQTLVRLKMRNLISRAVFDKTFKAAEKLAEPDLVVTPAAFSYGSGGEYHFIDQDSYDDLTLTADQLGDDRLLLADNLLIQVQKYNGRPIGVQFPPHVELTVADTEPGVRGDTASGGCHQGRDARNRARDPGAAVHQGGGEGEGAHRDARVRRPGVIAWGCV